MAGVKRENVRDSMHCHCRSESGIVCVLAEYLVRLQTKAESQLPRTHRAPGAQDRETRPDGSGPLRRRPQSAAEGAPLQPSEQEGSYPRERSFVSVSVDALSAPVSFGPFGSVVRCPLVDRFYALLARGEPVKCQSLGRMFSQHADERFNDSRCIFGQAGQIDGAGNLLGHGFHVFHHTLEPDTSSRAGHACQRAMHLCIGIF